MNDLINTVDWSRCLFALTAMYHWIFVPLTLGLSIIVAVMESIYMHTQSVKWLSTTKFWMTVFAVNFAVGVATGMILEFEFGTNWSNYSWFVGDVFGAPLAIEGLLAFFMEATFGAVMFFGWDRVSPRFHLVSTWLTALGASISALWILVANAWMQNPVGMEFDPEQMRNVMSDFGSMFSAVAINKFFHSVLSGWCLAGVVVVGISCWFLFKKRNVDFAIRSIKVGAMVGFAGIMLTTLTGDGSAVEVAKSQPMKLAAMEGLYKGDRYQSIVAFGILNPDKKWNNSEDEYMFDISIPYGLSILSKHNASEFVPGIADIINGLDMSAAGDTLNTISYVDRIKRGKMAHESLRLYDAAKASGNYATALKAKEELKENYKFFGYGYFDSVDEAVPPVAITFYAFHIMVIIGGYLVLFFVVVLYLTYKRPKTMIGNRMIHIVAMLSIPLVYVCSQAGWVVAEVGRQPWVVQDLLPTRAAVSAILASNVELTFCVFAVIFIVFLVAAINIVCNFIKKSSRSNMEIDKH